MDHQSIQRYLQDVLVTDVSIRRWEAVQRLPFHLRDTYDFAELVLFDRLCVLVISDRKLDLDVDIRRQLEVVAGHAPRGAIAIYVVPALASHERRRLIMQGVPFIVPGNQMFLPALGLDLREYFRDRRVDASHHLSPSTQALLFTALLSPWEEDIHPQRLNERFGYTPMTVSRAARELQAAGLAAGFSVGREKWLRFGQSPKQVWQHAQTWLRSPVGKHVWTLPAANPIDEAPLAGLSALAAQSSLAEPVYAERAIYVERWKHMQHHERILHAPHPGATHWQIWRYDPDALAGDGRVDPLSLIVSLRDERDERVQQARAQLEARLPW
ncbi:MAG: hypothetical protein NVV68_09835 [Dokdonella sp.]|nr:hypothetical protein [Dokdonella sp.]